MLKIESDLTHVVIFDGFTIVPGTNTISNPKITKTTFYQTLKNSTAKGKVYIIEDTFDDKPIHYDEKKTRVDKKIEKLGFDFFTSTIDSIKYKIDALEDIELLHAIKENDDRKMIHRAVDVRLRKLKKEKKKIDDEKIIIKKDDIENKPSAKEEKDKEFLYKKIKKVI